VLEHAGCLPQILGDVGRAGGLRLGEEGQNVVQLAGFGLGGQAGPGPFLKVRQPDPGRRPAAPAPEAGSERGAQAAPGVALGPERAGGSGGPGRGFALVRVAGGYRYQSHPDLAVYVERFVLEGQSARLSSAALETLAIVAYKQPITRPEIDEVRGVDSGSALKILLERDLVRIMGRKDDVGRPVLYGTSGEFLRFFGLKSLKDLPPLR